MAKAKGGLGRDFFSVLDDNIIDSAAKSAAKSIRISLIEPRSDQPRKYFDHEALEALADSIAEYGVLQPIILRENPLAAGTYEIIAGERRWRASKMAGLDEIPAVILDGDDLKAAQVALIENVQREDLNAVEEAFGYRALIERFGLTQDQVAKQVGKSRSAITNTLRLLDLPDTVLEYLRDGKLSAGHARALLGLKNEENMLPMADRIISRELSVREAERDIRLMNNPPKREIASGDDQVKVYMKDLERRTVKALGRKVKIVNTPKKKALEISYISDDDLAEILKLLCGKDFFDEV